MLRKIFKFCHTSPLNKISSFIQAFIAKNVIRRIFLSQHFTTMPKILIELHELCDPEEMHILLCYICCPSVALSLDLPQS